MTFSKIYINVVSFSYNLDKIHFPSPLTSVKKMDDELPSARFATVDEAEFRRILIEKDAKNTRRATNGAVKIFRTYLKAKHMPETFENFTNEKLDDIVGKFYVEVRQENGDKYQRSSLFSKRYGLNRHLSLSRNGDNMKY